jgi:glycosyltransferase involved in cell wall biosynthesis
MKNNRLASIIINNYNYGHFLRQSINSALSQSYPNTEIIVVDDGSTDSSLEIISSYREEVIAIVKSNQGQASALNTGFARSRGEIIIFLDADDMLYPTAIEEILPFFEHPEVVKIQWPLSIIDAEGRISARTKPVKSNSMPEGDLRDIVIQSGPSNLLWPPTSANAWSRDFLLRVLPMDEEVYRMGADTYLFELAPFVGLIRTVHEPQAYYRVHGANHHTSMNFEEQLEFGLRMYDHYSLAAYQLCAKMGIDVEFNAWQANSWWYKLKQAVECLDAIVPKGEPFILVDDSTWGMQVDSVYYPIPFLEKDGEYWGAAPDDATAIAELERIRREGARFIAFAWSAFWWLDHYRKFQEYLRSQFPCILENERLVVFELSEQEVYP